MSPHATETRRFCYDLQMRATKKLLESLLRPTVSDIVKHKRSYAREKVPKADRYSDVQNALMITNRINFRLSNLGDPGHAQMGSQTTSEKQRKFLLRDLKQLTQLIKGL